MAIITGKELREKTDQELLDQLAMEKKDLFDATVRGASGEAIKAHEKREGKRLIARIQTILNERKRRRELEQKIQKLEPRTQGAKGPAKELADGEARPQLPRVNGRRLRAKLKKQDKSKGKRVPVMTGADLAALKLAEAKRLRAAIQRDDAGETK